MPKTAVVLALALLGLGASIPAQTPCEDLTRYPVRFAILGDRTGDHQEGVYESIVAEIARLRPDFVMTVGDMIEGYTNDTIELNRQWDEYFGIVSPLTMPIHFTPGNHDITWDAMEPAYRARVGEPYYSLDHRGIHIVVLDNSRTESVDEMADVQLQWLTDDLVRHVGACQTLVFVHKPFWYRTLGDGLPDALHDIFKAHGVDAVVTGHFHTYFSGEFDGVRYTSLGSSGGAPEDGPEGLLYHFGWVTVDSLGVHIAPIRKDAVLPWDVQTVAEARAASLVKSIGIGFAEPIRLTDALEPADTIVSVLLQCPIAGTQWNDTLRWQTPEGWTITPAVYPYALSEGAATAQFIIKPAAKLFPLPEVSTRLPFAEDKVTTVRRTLEVARTARCARVDEPVVIDGQLTEGCWTHSVTTLFDRNGTPAGQDATSLHFAYDSDNLYVAAICHDSDMAAIRATLTERDAEVYTEDAVGWMIQPGESPGADVAQVYVSAIGILYDQLITQASDGYWSGQSDWNGELEAGAVRTTDRFTVEIRIPLVQFGVTVESGDRWRMNCRRRQTRTGSTAVFQPPWSYDPATLGELVFE